MESLWNPSGILVASLWNPCRSFARSLWNPYGILVDHIPNCSKIHFKSTSKSLPKRLKISLGSSQPPPKEPDPVFDRFLIVLETPLGPLWGASGHPWDTLYPSEGARRVKIRVFWGDLSAGRFFHQFLVKFWGAQNLKKYDFVQEGLQFSTFDKDLFFDAFGVTFGSLFAPCWGQLRPLYPPRGASRSEKVHFGRVFFRPNFLMFF